MPKRFAVGSHLGSSLCLAATDAAVREIRSSSLAAAQRPPTIESLEDRTLMSRTWVVAPFGNDGSAGTLGSPFHTIQHAANLAQWGDTVLIEGGTYHETVTPRNGGVTFENYNGQNVSVSGADPVGGWSRYSGNIYSARAWSLGEGYNQVFYNGRMLAEAQFPNSNLNPSQPSVSHVGRYAGGVIYDSSLTQGNGYWNGATIHIIPGQGWVAYTGTVTGSGPGWIRISVAVNGSKEIPTAGNAYYLTGKLQALNSAGEFYTDNSGRVYVWAPGNANPANADVEVKHRQYAFDLRNVPNTTIQGVNIFASTIITGWTSRNTTINHVTAQYLSQYPSYGWSVPNDSGISLAGVGSVLENSTIAYSAGDGVYVGNSNIRVVNNVIHDVDYGATDAAGVRIYASNDYIGNNTIYNTGRDGINHRGTGLQIVNNDVSYSMLQTTDGGGIYAVSTNGGGTVIANNYVHDIYAGGWGGDGIFLDNNSSNYTVDGNTTWNLSSGIKLNYTSYNENIYGNRLGASRYSIESNGWVGFEYSWAGSRVYNNVFYMPTMIGNGASMWGNAQASGSPAPGNIQTPPPVQAPPVVSTPAPTPTPSSSSTNGFNVIQAEQYSASRGIVDRGNAVGSIDNGDYVSYANLNFGSGGATLFNAAVAVAPGYANQQLQIRLDSPTGQVVGTLRPSSTGSWTNYQTQSTSLTRITGVHTIYLVGSGATGIANVEWFKFS